MPKLSIEIQDLADGCYNTRIKVDGVPIGVVQRVEYRHHAVHPTPVIEIDQLVYSRKHLPMVRILETIPHLKYTPMFVNDKGEPVSEDEACFIEDKPEWYVNLPDGGAFASWVTPAKECAMCALDPQRCVTHA